MKTRLLLAAATLLAASSVHADIIANFTDGTGTTLPDQYAGAIGGGWSTGWAAGTGGQLPTASVATATPINGSGNYLSATFNNIADRVVGRSFYNDGTNGGVLSSQPVTFSFDYRIDTLTGWGDSASDYLTVESGSSTTYGASASSAFIIRAYGATSGNAGANVWSFYNGAGNGAGFDALNFVSSTMAITAGTTYHFSITIDAATEKYTASIFDGTNTVNSGLMGWRADAATNPAASLGFNGKVGTAGDSFAVSIDNINISAVPEPSTYGLIGAGALAAVAMVRRRRKLAGKAA